jgi:FNIP Repeat
MSSFLESKMSSSLRKRVTRDTGGGTPRETRSLSKKRKQDQVLNIIIPVQSLILPHLNDRDAFAFFCTNRYFTSMIPSYPLKRVLQIRTILPSLVTVYTAQQRQRERDERGARIIKKAYFSRPSWGFLPLSLLGQIQTLIISYKQISCFLLHLGYEGIKRSLLKHIEFTESIFMESAGYSMMSLPPGLLTLDCAGSYYTVSAQPLFIIDNLKSIYPHLHTLTLPLGFNRSIVPGDLPESLHTLVFTNDYKHAFVPLALPSALVRLEFHGNLDRLYDQEVRILPDSLQFLIVGHGFNRPLPYNILPSSLIELSLGTAFNQMIPNNVLPENLEILEFGHKFNQLLPRLPVSLKSLLLRGDYNQPLTKYEGEGQEIMLLNNGLLKLELSASFNHNLDKALPSSLQELILGDDFNQPISNGSLPNDLKRLHFGLNFNNLLTCENLPQTLTCLFFDSLSLFQFPLPRASSLSHLTCLLLPGSYPYSALVAVRRKSISASLQSVVIGKHYAFSFSFNLLGDGSVSAFTKGESKLCSNCIKSSSAIMGGRVEIQRGSVNAPFNPLHQKFLRSKGKR